MKLIPKKNLVKLEKIVKNLNPAAITGGNGIILTTITQVENRRVTIKRVTS